MKEILRGKGFTEYKININIRDGKEFIRSININMKWIFVTERGKALKTSRNQLLKVINIDQFRN